MIFLAKTLFAVRFEQETLRDIEIIAKQKKRKKSDLIRIIVENYVEQHKM